MMRRWILARLGAAEWLDDLTYLGALADTLAERRDREAARADAAEAELADTVAWAEAAEERAMEAERLAQDLREQLDAMAPERDAAMELARLHIDAFAAVLEPAPPGEPCRKMRCHSDEHAEQFARLVERQTRMPVGAMRTYTCNRCGLQPVTNERWRHISMADSDLRGSRKAGKIHKPLREQALDDAQAEALKARLFSEQAS